MSRRGAGAEVVRWIEAYCRVPEGRMVGQPVRLRPWQRRIITGTYDGKVPVRRAIASFPRKNGKTSLAACLLLAHLCGPRAVRNSQLYSAAQSREQAAIVFALAAKMVRMHPDLAAHVTVKETAKTLVCEEIGTIYRALSAEASTAYGFSPVFVIHDELGQVRGPRSELYEALESAMGAHERPLSVIISTQAPDDGDLLSLLIDEARTGADPRTKLFLWTAPDGCDILDRKAWKTANPALGDFRSLADVEDQAAQARALPSMEAAFRNLILNQRVAADTRFVPEAVWQQNAGTPEPGPGRTVLAIDLSQTVDLTAVVAVTDRDGVAHVVPRVYLPGAELVAKSQRDRVPYDLWARDGLVIPTPGPVVDYARVARDLLAMAERDDVVAIAADPWRLRSLLVQLREAGGYLTSAGVPDDAVGSRDDKGPWTLHVGVRSTPIAPFGQGFRSMAPALDLLERRLMGGELRHGGHPVLTWMAANAAVKTDEAGNRKFDKRKATGRIDGLVALAMAVATLAETADAEARSVYESRDFLVL